MQLLCAASDEAPGVSGLGCVGERVVRLSGAGRVPQLGWNRMTVPADAVFLRPGLFYFANSYRLAGVPPGWSGATGYHGHRFVAALERGGVLACQFHPELSGTTGAGLLRRWLDGAAGAAAATAAATSVAAAAGAGRLGPRRPARRALAC